jgi:hypothetical protein
MNKQLSGDTARMFGVVEYWSVGVMGKTQYSITPSLQPLRGVTSWNP